MTADEENPTASKQLVVIPPAKAGLMRVSPMPRLWQEQISLGLQYGKEAINMVAASSPRTNRPATPAD